MKNFKKIIALLTSVMMLSSVSVFAEVPEDESPVTDIDANTAVEFILTSTAGDTVEPGDSFDIAVKVGNKGTTDYIGIGTLTFDVEYDTSLFDVVVSASQPTKKSASSFTGEDEEDYYWCANAKSAYLADGTIHAAKVSQNAGKAYAGYFNAADYHCVSTENAFLTFTFTVKADAPATKDVTLSLTGCAATNLLSTVENTNVSTSGTVTFDIAGEEPEPENPVQATEGADGVITVTGSETLAGKKVLVKDNAIATGSSVVEGSRLVVTYDGGAPKTYNIFEALGTVGGGELATKNIAFGIIYTENLDASKFVFELTGLSN